MSHTTILCATDLAASGDAALHLATLMAKATKKKLVLLHAMEIEGRVDLDSLDPSVVPAAKAFEVRVASRMASHSAALDAAAATALSEGVPVEVSVEEGRPWETILDAAARYDAGLVVLGDHVSEGGLGDRIGERLLGSTAERVVRLHSGMPAQLESAQSTAPLQLLSTPSKQRSATPGCTARSRSLQSTPSHAAPR